MPSTRQQASKPVVVTSRPKVVKVVPDTSTPICPSTPPTPKAVRFDEFSERESSRPLTHVERRSFEHFEVHAQGCTKCQNPIDVHRIGGQLCGTGHALAQDLTMLVYYKNGQIFSRSSNGGQDARVQVDPVEFVDGRSLLKLLSRLQSGGSSTTSRSSTSSDGKKTTTTYTVHNSSSRSRAPPVVSYDPPRSQTYREVRPRRDSFNLASEEGDDRPSSSGSEGSYSVIVEPASSKPSRGQGAGRNTIQLASSKKYATVIVDSHRRGSLYNKDGDRSRKEHYRLETRNDRDPKDRAKRYP